MYLAQSSLIEYLFFIIHICYNIERGEMNEKIAKSTFSFNDLLFPLLDVLLKQQQKKQTKKNKNFINGN